MLTPRSPYGWYRRSLYCDWGNHEFILVTTYMPGPGWSYVPVRKRRACWWCDTPGLLSEAELLGDDGPEEP